MAFLIKMLEYYFFGLLSIFYVLTGLIVFSSFQKHLLSTLLRLEFIILNIFLILIIILRKENIESYLLLVFLVFSVVEGGVGLSILVSFIRSHGSDMIKSFRIV